MDPVKLPQIIEAIREAQKIQETWAAIPFEKKIEILLQWNADFDKNLLPQATPPGQPAGPVLLLVDEGPAEFQIFQRLIPIIFSGNSVLLAGKFSGAAESLLSLQKLLPERVLQFLQADLPQQNLLIQHPGIKHIVAFSSAARVQEIAKLAAQTFKSVQLQSRGKNSVFVLKDFRQDENFWSELMSACFVDCETSAWQIEKIFILEKDEKDFLNLLAKKIEKFHSENKIEAAFEKDVSHCSELHQQVTAKPKVIVDVVKYAFDMVKWNAVVPNQEFIWFYGDPEKIEKIFAKSSATLILSWPPQKLVGPGRGNYLGSTDFSFFSENFFKRTRLVR